MMGSGPGSFLFIAAMPQKQAQAFNNIVGHNVIPFSVSGGLFGLALGCHETVGTGHERMMMNFVIGLLKESSQDPSLAKQYREERLEKLRLANMEAWDKHLK